MLQPFRIAAQPESSSAVSDDLWTLDFEGEWTAPAQHCKYSGKVTFVLPEKDGPVRGNGPMDARCDGPNYSTVCTASLILDGTVAQDTLTFIPRSKVTSCNINSGGFSVTWSDYPDEHFNVNRRVSIPVRNGAETIQDVVDADGTQRWRLHGKDVERWRVTYTGYDVLRQGDSYEHFKGLKVHWRTTVDFRIQGGQYRGGTGKNVITGIESYSHPPGVWDCVLLKGSGRVAMPSYVVPGQATKSTARLIFPDGNNFRVGYTCLMDTDQFKDHLRARGYKSFPSLRGVDKTKTVRGKAGDFLKGFHDISLMNYEKVIMKGTYEGYQIKVQKLK